MTDSTTYTCKHSSTPFLSATNYHSWKNNISNLLAMDDSLDIVLRTELAPAANTTAEVRDFLKRLQRSFGMICIRKKNLCPDAPGTQDALDAPWQRTYCSQREMHRQCEFGRSTPWHRTFGRRMPGHHASGCSSPWHLLTGWSVSGHFPSGRSRVRAFSLWTQPCQGIFLLDAAVSEHFPSGCSRIRANGIRTTRVMVPRPRCLSRHGTS